MKKILYNILEYLILIITGGSIYYAIELLWRGHSHWTMFILGGICFTSVGLLNEIFSWNMYIELQAISGGLIITILEFITGIIVNIIFKLNVWDYSNLPMNILGQICLPFTLLWIVLSMVIIFIDDRLRYKLFNEDKPYYVSIFDRR